MFCQLHSSDNKRHCRLCRGVSLDRCEDITDAAIICLSKYKTAHVSELAALNDLSLQQAVGQAAIVRQGVPASCVRLVTAAGRSLCLDVC